MPGCSRVSIDEAIKIAKEAEELGIAGIALFPSIEDNLKTKDAKERFFFLNLK